MILEDIQPRERVAYVPRHAPESPEPGTVSSKNDRFVFVKFDKQLAKFGWDGTTSQSCDPADLVPWHGEALEPVSAPEIESVAFELPADRGYTAKASYLKSPDSADALIEIFKDGAPVRDFLFPAYKIWNIAAHFRDIVDGEIENSASGYKMAAWDGISGAVFIIPKKEAE